MEKRAVLAFVLIIMIWIGYYYFVIPMYVPTSEPVFTEGSGNPNDISSQPNNNTSPNNTFPPVDPPVK